MHADWAKRINGKKNQRMQLVRFKKQQQITMGAESKCVVVYAKLLVQRKMLWRTTGISWKLHRTPSFVVQRDFGWLGDSELQKLKVTFTNEVFIWDSIVRRHSLREVTSRMNHRNWNPPDVIIPENILACWEKMEHLQCSIDNSIVLPKGKTTAKAAASIIMKITLCGVGPVSKWKVWSLKILSRKGIIELAPNFRPQKTALHKLEKMFNDEEAIWRHTKNPQETKQPNDWMKKNPRILEA